VTDDELRETLRLAHRGEPAPPLARVRARRPRPARPWLPLALAAAAALAVFLWPRRPATPPPPLAIIHVRAPLDFLLRPPGVELLTTTPRFDAKGWMP
jgi:hypothetical protein